MLSRDPARALSRDPTRADGVHLPLAALVRGRGPLRRVVAAVAGRFVTTRAWERLGFARLRDYAVERVGLSARSIQDLAHVDGALAGLPEIDRALGRGDVSWTQARLLARVAQRQDEREWLARASALTASQLSREVRRVDRGSLEAGAPALDEDGVDAERRETVLIRCTPYARGKWLRARQMARRVAGETLPVWACAEAIAAEVMSALPTPALGAGWPLRLESALAVESPAPGNGGRGSANRCATQGAGKDIRRGEPRLPPFLRPLVRGLEGADAHELDRRLRRAVALEQRLESRIGPLLRIMCERRLYRALGFASLARYAREELEMSPRRAQMLLRLERAGDRCPALLGAYREGRLSWVQAHALVPVLSSELAPELAERWVRWAQRVTVRRLEEDVDRALVLRDLDPVQWERTAGLPSEAGNASETRDAQIGARPRGSKETARLFFTAPRDVARLLRAVLGTVRRRIERQTGRLATEGEALEAMCDHVLEVWSRDSEGSTALRREHRVFARDGWRCTAPACSSQRNLHDHHILENRTTLCAWHHLRGVHAGIVRCTGKAPVRLRFALGVRPNGPPLARFASGDLRVDQ